MRSLKNFTSIAQLIGIEQKRPYILEKYIYDFLVLVFISTLLYLKHEF